MRPYARKYSTKAVAFGDDTSTSSNAPLSPGLRPRWSRLESQIVRLKRFAWWSTQLTTLCVYCFDCFPYTHRELNNWKDKLSIRHKSQLIYLFTFVSFLWSFRNPYYTYYYPLHSNKSTRKLFTTHSIVSLFMQGILFFIRLFYSLLGPFSLQISLVLFVTSFLLLILALVLPLTSVPYPHNTLQLRTYNHPIPKSNNSDDEDDAYDYTRPQQLSGLEQLFETYLRLS